MLGALFGCSGSSPEEMLASAKTQLARGDAKSASIQLKNALQIDPSLAEARFLLGRALLDTDDPGAATIELAKAGELQYPIDELAPVMAKALLQQGQFKKVIDDFAALELSSPRAVADLKASVAGAYTALGNLAAAASELTTALKAQPDYLPALLAEVRLLAARGDGDGALKLVDEALRKSPSDLEALLLRGDLLLRRGDTGRATAAYRSALESRPDSMPAHVGLLTALLAQGDMKSAHQALAALKKIRPLQGHTLYFEAQLALRDGDYKLAEAISQQLLKAAPDNPRLLQLSAGIAYRKGNLIQAEKDLDKVLRAVPNLVPARQLLARTYLRMGRSDKVLEVLQPILGQGADANTLTVAASAHMQQLNIAKAEDLYSQALRLDPGNLRSRTALALSHLTAGKTDIGIGELDAIAGNDPGTTADMELIAAHLRKRDFDNALKAIDRLDAKDPGKAIAHSMRGGVMMLKGDLGAARQSFERALSIDATFYSALENLVNLELRESKPDQAEQRLVKFLKAQPTDARALISLATLRTNAGKSRSEIEPLLTRAITNNPTDIAPRVTLINYFASRKDFNAALDVARAGVIALPDSPDLLQSLGRMQLLAGDANQALSSLSKLAALQPKSAQPHLDIADVHVSAKNYDAAVQSIDRALVIAPNLITAQQKMISVQIAANRYAEATKVAKLVQKQRPQSHVGYLFEGEIEALQRNWKAAAVAFRSALDRSAQDVHIATKLHAALQSANDRVGADSVARNWREQHPEDAVFAFYLGKLAYARRDYQTAAAEFARVTKVQPENGAAINNLAYSLLQLRRPEALEYAQKLNKLKTDNPPYMHTLAEVLLANGRVKEAVMIQSKVVVMQPQNASMRLALARMHLAADDKPSARRELARLAELGDKFARQGEVAKMLEQVR